MHSRWIKSNVGDATEFEINLIVGPKCHPHYKEFLTFSPASTEPAQSANANMEVTRNECRKKEWWGDLWWASRINSQKTISQTWHTSRWWYIPILRNAYSKGTSIQQAPVFQHLRALRKSPWSLLSGWMNHNYTVCCWFPTSSNILIYFHHSSGKSGLKVADCTVQSAEYWCFYGSNSFFCTVQTLKRDIIYF